VPLWLGDPGSPPRLAYVRRVQVGAEEFLQGVLVDWQRLELSLLAELGDLLTGARLVPRVDGVSSSLSLATLPAVLAAPTPPVPQVSGWTPARTTLLAGWVSALLMLGAVGFTLHSSIVFGERRARFASAVTHELRTPLTTFRMYSEMLAKGMVGEDRRAEYLDTLCRESDRLSGLVENVLAYARLEEGRSPLRRRSVRVDELFERALPELQRRAQSSGGELTLDLDGAAELQVSTDPEAVGQILFNLVDNACKYGAPPFRISARPSNSRARSGIPGVELRVADAGPGIPPERAAAVFRPFDRGGREQADGTSGIGLGLALARGLARDLGGELQLDASAAGTTFVLRLPGDGPAS
ncbi:MAG: HAMP domain-containing sensor histidine kinase, partial [Planctomycetota bacterium]